MRFHPSLPSMSSKRYLELSTAVCLVRYGGPVDGRVAARWKVVGRTVADSLPRLQYSTKAAQPVKTQPYNVPTRAGQPCRLSQHPIQ